MANEAGTTPARSPDASMTGPAGPVAAPELRAPEPAAELAPELSRAGSPWGAVLLFLAIGLMVWAVAALSLAHLPYTGDDGRSHTFPGRPWFEAWVHWDAGWYYDIARMGYWKVLPNQQGPLAFFPAYPILMQAAAPLVGGYLLAGIAVTVAAGAAAAGLFFSWLRARVSPAAAWTALLLFVLYPFAFYIYGAIYADAVFVAAILGSFVLLERDSPWLAGLVGAVATAARPVGSILVVALVIRVIERRGGWRQVRWRDAGVLVAGAGVGAFCVYTWVRFGSPLAFVEAQGGWSQDPGVATWLKFQFWEDVQDFRNPLAWLVFVSHPVMTFAALALVPRVLRRFGWGYASYALLVVGVAALSIKNFFGMGRYVLAAFPCFAVAGELLAERVRLRAAVLAGSGAALLLGTSFFARGHYLS